MKEMASEPYAFKLQKGAVSIKGKMEKERQTINSRLYEKQKIQNLKS